MLPAANRLRRSSDFASAVRAGARARSGRLVVHQVLATPDAGAQPRVGLVVGKSVGSSVMRHRVSRQLRAQLAQRLDRLPPASVTVVRALPHAAGALSQEFGRDLDRALDRAATARPGRR